MYFMAIEASIISHRDVFDKSNLFLGLSLFSRQSTWRYRKWNRSTSDDSFYDSNVWDHSMFDSHGLNQSTWVIDRLWSVIACLKLSMIILITAILLIRKTHSLPPKIAFKLSSLIEKVCQNSRKSLVLRFQLKTVSSLKFITVDAFRKFFFLIILIVSRFFQLR